MSALKKLSVGLGILVVSVASMSAVTAQTVANIDPLSVSVQAVGSSDQLLDFCRPIIKSEYNRRPVNSGACVAATNGFLNSQSQTLDTVAMGPVVADAVTKLVTLYQPQDCRKARTELPDAVETAISFTKDPVQIDALRQIVQDLLTCQNAETAAVANAVVSPGG
jgi:hypothetical protein